LRGIAQRPLDVHLMIADPARYIDDFAAAGADWIVVHQEACLHLHRVIQQIKAKGKKAGVALNPATPPATIEYVLADLDLVLIMSVNPGFGGQQFIPSALDKIRRLRLLLDEHGRDDVIVEVDGGVTPANAAEIVRAGADALVAGNAVFSQPDYAVPIAAIRRAGAVTA
jgi:ribulose-phosphate 3-epimerase